MSATATNSQTPPVASADVDSIDTTEADVLAALGQLSPDSTDTAADTDTAETAATTDTADEDAAADEVAAALTDEEAPAAAPAAESDASTEAAAAEPTAEQKEIAALKQQLADLAAKIPAAPVVAAPPAADRPPLSAIAPEVFETVTEPGELAARELSLSRLHEWTLRNEDGGRIGDTDISRAEVLDLRASTWAALHRHIPARRQQLAEISHAEGEAVTAYPALKDAASTEAKAVAQFLAENPALKRLPNAKLIAADAVLGRLTRTTKAKPAAAPAPKQQPPRAPTSAARPGVLPPRISPRSSDLNTATARLSKGNGSVEDVASVIAASLPE